MNRLIAGAVGFAIWTGLVFWAGSTFIGRGADLKASQKDTAQAVAAVEQVNHTRAIEHSQACTMAAIGASHEEDRAAAPAVADSVVAGLRDGDLQLSNDLAACNTSLLSQAVAGTVERDARAQLRDQVAADIV